MQACMICSKNERVFNIFYDNNGNNRYSVKDDMIEFFGEKVEQFLSENDVICNTCMNILDSVAKLKRRLWPVLCGHLNKFHDWKPIKLGKTWDTFATYLQFSGDLDNDSISSRNSTPNLLTPKYAIAYEDDVKNENNRLRSQSRLSCSSSIYYRSGTPFTDKEIENVFKGKRKKKRNCRSTQRSHSLTYSSRQSPKTRYNYESAPCRPESVLSNSSYQSYYRPQSRNSLVSLSNSLRYDKTGRLMNKRTRSVSRTEDAIGSKLAQYEDMIYKCEVEGCEEEYFSDLRELTEHKVNYHKMLALFWCDECRFSYTSQVDFTRHEKLYHSYNMMCCLYCSIILQNKELLQEHLNEHLLHSVPCKYCDKFFLDKRTCEHHVKECHKGKKHRIKRRPQTILDRIDKDVSDDDDDSISANNIQCKEKLFTVRILEQTRSKKDDADKIQQFSEDVNKKETVTALNIKKCIDLEARVELIPLKF